MGRAWPILILLAFCLFCSSWGSLVIIPIQLEMRQGLGISGEALAALIWVFSFSVALGAPLAQAFVGHWPRRMLLIASLIVMGTAAIGLALAETWGQAMAARVFMALGAASVMPTTAVIASSQVTPEQRPAALSIVFVGLTLSLVLALPLSSAIADLAGWRAAWYVAGGAAYAAAIGVAIGVSAEIRGTRASLRSMISVLGNPSLGLTIATTGLLIAGGFMTYSMISFWFVEVGGAPRSALTFALLASGLASMMGNGVSSVLVRQMGPDQAILGGLLATAGCFLVLWVAPHTYVLSYPAFVFFSMGWAMCMAPLQARLVGRAGEQAQLALALNASALFAGQGLGAVFGGAVYERLGPAMLPPASMLVMGLAALVFTLARRAGRTGQPSAT